MIFATPAPKLVLPSAEEMFVGEEQLKQTFQVGEWKFNLIFLPPVGELMSKDREEVQINKMSSASDTG